jgi:THO complex subunit 1
MGKLCQVNHGNLEACRDPSRQFLPTVREFFDEAIEQLDPNAQVERAYWLISQPDWAWKALRLLAKRSAHYFMQVNQNVKPIGEYLEAICMRLSKEMSVEQLKQQQQLLKQQQREQKEMLRLQQQQQQQQSQLLQQQQQQQEVIDLEKDQASPDSVKQEEEEVNEEDQNSSDIQ